jgi:hypothetical protein
VKHNELNSSSEIDSKNQEFILSTETTLNDLLVAMDLPEVSIDDLSMEEASDIRQNLDPRFEDGQMRVRQIVNEEGVSRLPDDLAQIILNYAEQNNMTGGETHFEVGQYDVVCSLGGANKAPYDRARSILEAIAEGTIDAKLIVFSGSPRELRDAEKQKAAGYAPEAQTEADLAKGALETLSTEFADLIEAKGIKLDVLETTKGTFTATEIQQLIDKYELPAGAKIGLQTTQIYQPFTQLEGSAVGLANGVDVVVAGHASAEAVVRGRKPETYLSELTRALLSSVRLLEAKKASQI